jgi:hypothetical protein
MEGKAERNRRPDAIERGVSNAQYAWAPSGLVGEMKAASLISALTGIFALILAALSTLSGVAWVAALLAVICGLRLLMPRMTTLQRSMCWTGIGAGAIAIVLLLA